jgi:hypothetical protein
MSPYIEAISPSSLLVGPPADTALFVYGGGFEAGSVIVFGGQVERTDYLTNALSTIITAGMFPNQDPTVEVMVRNLDGSESNVAHFAFVPFDTVPPMPIDGSVRADLDTLKVFIGARTNQDDALLQGMLYAATEWWYERVYASHQAHPDVQTGILMRASRLYKRRQSPEGIAGFGGEGAVVRLVRGDPDEEDLLERHMDYTRVGIA